MNKQQLLAARKQSEAILERARARKPQTLEHIETFPNGRQMKITFSSIFDVHQFRDSYFRNRDDIQELGLEGALQKWHDEEAVERRKLGLRVKKRY